MVDLSIDVSRQTRTFADCAPSLMTEEMLTGAPPRPSKQFSRNWQKTYRDALGVRRAKKDAQRAAAAAEQALADEQSLAAAMALVIEQAHAEQQARLLASTRYSPSRDSSGPGIASGPGSSSSRKGKEKVTGGSSARGGRTTPTTPRARGVSIPGTQGDHGPSGGWGPYGTQGTPGRPVRQSRRGKFQFRSTFNSYLGVFECLAAKTGSLRIINNFFLLSRNVVVCSKISISPANGLGDVKQN